MIYNIHNASKILRADSAAINARIKSLESQLVELKISKGKLSELLEWTQHAQLLGLHKNETTRVHQLIEAIQSKRIVECLEKDEFAGSYNVVIGGSNDSWYLPRIQTSNSFIVRHDWASAFKQALEDSEFDYEFRLPYTNCTFEIVINNKIIIAYATQEPGERIKITLFIGMDGYWIAFGVTDEELYGSSGDIKVFKFVLDQIRAICIALDTEIAETIAVRAPAGLNKKRIEKGKPPVFDYHIIDLGQRYRNQPVHTGTHASPRLHFRRGHWRHYEDHRTWIKWVLVGNPHLGFIDKHYTI